MPKRNNFEKNMPELYLADLFEKLLLGWVLGQRAVLPGISERESVMNFLQYFEKFEEDIQYETALQKYWRNKVVLYDILIKKNTENESKENNK